MKMAGDVKEEHRLHAIELQSLEKEIEANPKFSLAEIKAKFYCCLAHDWYQMDMEEEGHRLLLKAESVCPGYFKGTVIKQVEESEDFGIIIKNLTIELLQLLSQSNG
jgi:hypothetical protein